MRALAGLVVLGLFAWLLFALFAPGPAEAELVHWTSSAQCRECHAEVYAEWEQSWHAKSWIDEDVRALSNDFQDKNCIDCHAPRPVFTTGIGKRVLPRSSRRSEGVDCISCHALPEGGVAGTITRKSAACRPVTRVELSRADYCGVCHDQHKTVQQWRATPFAEAGTSCVDCHMPYRDGDPNRGRIHVFRGAHDLAYVKSAVELRGERDGDGWRIEVENVAAGHHFPTDERSRAADVFWRPAGDESAPWTFLHRIRDPYRYEVDIPSTLIPYGETWSGRLDQPGAVEVGLFYKLTPYYRDPETGVPRAHETVTRPEEDARLLHSIVLSP